uniref:CASP-like protein n=1 Tax=Oryza glaberrima TaxID=4538 RepID=I1QGR2_ORYGL
VTAIPLFKASCSAAGVVVIFDRDIYACRTDPQLPCGKFELATACAFLSWAFSATSALVMFWLLASL